MDEVQENVILRLYAEAVEYSSYTNNRDDKIVELLNYLARIFLIGRSDSGEFLKKDVFLRQLRLWIICWQMRSSFRNHHDHRRNG